MKSNLGNFPELNVTFEDEPYEFTMQVNKMIEHIDKMKAELREKMKVTKDMHNYQATSAVERECLKAKLVVIKEILGE